MNDPYTPTLLVQVFVDRLCWFMASAGQLLAHGVVKTYEELRGVQVRAGVLSVVLHRQGDGFHLPQNLRYAGEWTIAAEDDRASLLVFFAQASKNIS